MLENTLELDFSGSETLKPTRTISYPTGLYQASQPLLHVYQLPGSPLLLLRVVADVGGSEPQIARSGFSDVHHVGKSVFMYIIPRTHTHM